MVTIYVGGYPRRCTESKVPKVLENIEDLKRYYLSKGIVSKDMLDKMYSFYIVKDEDNK